MKSEKDKFFDALDKKEGLKGVNFFFHNPDGEDVALEEVYAELNRMSESPVLVDDELF